MKFLKITLICFALSSSVLSMADRSLSADYWKLSNAYYSILRCYVDSVSDAQLTESAIRGMLKELDPHSVYIPKEEVERANESIVGNFDGIGISFQMIDDTLTVMQTIAGCPAEKVGMVAGDKIISVGDATIAGVRMSTNDISKRIRGPRGSEVSVRVVRQGTKEPIEFRIIRDKIPVNTLDVAYLVNPQTAYIKLNSFGQNTMQEIYQACDSLNLWKARNLILDLQGNGGGLLSTALYLADEFLENQKMIVYTEGSREPRTDDLATLRGRFEKTNLVVLVDEYSASASEIVAGAVQDWDRGLIVGRRTFGKGLVQRPMALSDGSHIRLTVARYYTPSGRCIQKPYNGGNEDYQKDLMKRLQHGELQSSDSIDFPDSLRYETLQLRRTVYGGGGIMPDVFVPLDTTLYSDYYRDLLAKGVFNKTIANFSTKNADKIRSRYNNFETFDREWTAPQELIDELIKNGDEAGVKFNQEEFEMAKTLMFRQIKAVVARNVWASGDYYKVMNAMNAPLQKAIEILNTTKNIQQYLKQKN